MLKTYWARRLCWPPAGKLWISGIQNFETLIFLSFESNWVILDNFCRNSSFTGSVGLVSCCQPFVEELSMCVWGLPEQKRLTKLFFLIFFDHFLNFRVWGAANESAASAASPDYVKFQAVIKSAASAASLRRGRTSGRLDHGFFFTICGRASGPKIVKIIDKGLKTCLNKNKTQKTENREK